MKSMPGEVRTLAEDFTLKFAEMVHLEFAGSVDHYAIAKRIDRKLDEMLKK